LNGTSKVRVRSDASRMMVTDCRVATSVPNSDHVALGNESAPGSSAEVVAHSQFEIADCNLKHQGGGRRWSHRRCDVRHAGIPLHHLVLEIQ